MKKVEKKKMAKRNYAKNNLKKGLHAVESKATKVLYKESIGLGAHIINLADSTTTFIQDNRKRVKSTMLKIADLLEGRVIKTVNSVARTLRAQA